ncbi:MAG: metallopeptidase family protein [Candidatus Polarisedimenticolia bacterium]
MPASRDTTMERAWDLFEAGDVELALEAADSVRLEDPDDPEATLLCAAGLQELGDLEQALPLARRAVELAPDEHFARMTLASLLYETCMFQEGLEVVDGALADRYDDPFAHHIRGLLLDALGRYRESDAAFARASEIDPDSFPPPLSMDRKSFDRAVQQAAAALPDEFRSRLGDLPVLVEDVPPPDLLKTLDDPAPDLLGLFVGVPLTLKTTHDVPSMPDAIYLFKRNLERACADEDELVEQIGVTLRHELGHYLGMDEDDLEEAGHA